MRKIVIEKLIICLLVFYIVVGCSRDGTNPSLQKTSHFARATPTTTALSTITPIIRPALTPTNIIEVAPTATLDQKSETKFLSHPLPDLLLSVNRANRNECVARGSEEIWLATYPYSKPNPLLFSTEVDYRFSTWSPDGKWIAYVESRPEIISGEKIGGQKVFSGVDSVWVVHPDGSEKRKISVEVPSAMFSHLMGINVVCDVISEIDYPLEWSPNGEYLVFMRAWIEGNMKWNYSYYLTEVSTGKSHILLTQTRKANILWGAQSNKIMIQSDTETFNQIDIQDIDNVELKQVKFELPVEMKDNTSYQFLPSEKEDLVYGIFRFENEKDQTNTFERVIIWKYDLVKKQWNKITEVPTTIWYRTTILKDRIISCDATSKEIQLLDPETWKIVGELQLPSNLYFQCVFQDFKEFNDQSGEQWGIFEGTVDETQKGLWAVQLRPSKETNPELIIDYSIITGKMNGLSTFSFKPQ